MKQAPSPLNVVDADGLTLAVDVAVHSERRSLESNLLSRGLYQCRKNGCGMISRLRYSKIRTGYSKA